MVDPLADPGRGEGASPLHSFDFKMGVQKMIMSEIFFAFLKKIFFGFAPFLRCGKDPGVYSFIHR